MKDYIPELLFIAIVLALCVFLTLILLPVQASGGLYPEKTYQKAWCEKQGGKVEHRLSDGSRVDCLTKDYAVEVEFAQKWQEGVGQALYYAYKTGKFAGIVLIVESIEDMRYLERLVLVTSCQNIRVWLIEPKDISGL